MPVRISTRPSDIVTPPLEPLPSRLTLPEPLGNMSIFLLELETMSLARTSKSPPSSGEVSSTTALMPLDAATIADTATLRRAVAELSYINSKSLDASTVDSAV